MAKPSRLNVGDLVRPYWDSRPYIVIKVYCRLARLAHRIPYYQVSNGLNLFSFKESDLILVRKVSEHG